MRADQMRDEKRRIGEAIAAQIPDHASIFINIGTTTESIARALLNHHHLKIITNHELLIEKLSQQAHPVKRPWRARWRAAGVGQRR